FNWTDNVGAVNYQMELADNAAFNNAQVFTITTSTKTVNNLLPSTTYFWRVKASHNGIDYGTWVGPWLFNSQASTVGILEMESQTFMVYPNPAQNVLHIPYCHVNEEVVVLDVMGKICFQSITHSEGLYTVDVSHLVPGLYILRMGSRQYPFVKE
ncbi:MAG: T9SS type A sorting domain-containing protein, partial [Bacteroidetes bacterium]|nr:T9SS type A sorting domain-containing protein [Bacteroidota bacterium]